MPRSFRRRAGRSSGSRRGNSNPLPVIAMTQAEAFERQVVRSSDATVLRGKLQFTASATGTPSVILILNPAVASNFGVRASSVALAFTRYRFKYIRVKFLSNQATSASGAVVGIQDDIAISGNTPTTASGVAELRASGTSFLSQAVPTSFEWRPADSNLWYYVSSDAIDTRLSVSGLMYVATSVSSVVDFEIDYSLVFKGATDAGAL